MKNKSHSFSLSLILLFGLFASQEIPDVPDVNLGIDKSMGFIAKEGKWLTAPISFLINNWEDHQIDIAMVIFNKRPQTSEEIQVSTQVKVNSTGQTEFQQTSVEGWNKYQVSFKQTFNKCGNINNPFSDRGYGLKSYLGVNYGVKRLSKFMFYLVPQIQI